MAIITVTTLDDDRVAPDGEALAARGAARREYRYHVDGSTAGSGADTIEFDASLAVTGVLFLDQGQLEITTDVTIDGDTTATTTPTSPINAGGACACSTRCRCGDPTITASLNGLSSATAIERFLVVPASVIDPGDALTLINSTSPRMCPLATAELLRQRHTDQQVVSDNQATPGPTAHFYGHPRCRLDAIGNRRAPMVAPSSTTWARDASSTAPSPATSQALSAAAFTTIRQ